MKYYLKTAPMFLAFTMFSGSSNAISIVEMVAGFQSAISQVHGDLEKKNAVNKSIAEAEQDHDKKERFNENATKVISQTQVPTDGCNQIALSRNLKESKAHKLKTIELLNRAEYRRNMYVTNQPQIVAAYIKLHQDKFCSSEDAIKTGCKEAPSELQNADLKVENLFEPNTSSTYSEAEDIAAQSFIQNITNPFPTPSIEGSKVKEIQGKAYLTAKMDEQRALSMAQHSFNSIYASRRKPVESELVSENQNSNRFLNFFNRGSDVNSIQTVTPSASDAQEIVNTAEEAQKQKTDCEAVIESTEIKRQQEIEQYIPKPANETFTTGTCLDSIFNTRINIFTFGNVDGTIDRILGMVTNKACAAVTGAWNNAIGEVNRKARVNINQPYAGNVFNATVTRAPTVSVTTNQQNQSLADRIISGFQNLLN